MYEKNTDVRIRYNEKMRERDYWKEKRYTEYCRCTLKVK